MATAEIREERREDFGNENHAFLLNEGVCPKCFGDAHIVAISGTAEFLEWYTANRHPEASRHQWFGQPDFSVGTLTFRCEDGHEMAIEQNVYGDWN